MFLYIFIFVFITSLCIGSFLNVVAYRSVTDKPFFSLRSTCNSCNKVIAFYDNVPVISWFLLGGKCRHCKNKISFLYPFIEILSGLLFTFLFFKVFGFSFLGGISREQLFYFFSYFIFFSALIVATRTDFQAMVIPQLFSIWLVPVGFLFAYFNMLNISFIESLVGAFLGYGILWGVAKLFKILTKKDGLGVGDMELLAMIGSFLGPIGVWFSLMVSSIIGLIFGGIYLLLSEKKIGTRIPFGPFLALGAILYFFFGDYFIKFLI